MKKINGTTTIMDEICIQQYWELVAALATNNVKGVRDTADFMLLALAVEASCYGLEKEANNFLTVRADLRKGCFDDYYVMKLGELIREQTTEKFVEEGLLKG